MGAVLLLSCWSLFSGMLQQMSQTLSGSSRFLRLGFGGRCPSPPPLLFLKHRRLPLRCAAVATEAPNHLWPEWLSFVDVLKCKGYLNSPTHAAASDVDVDYKILKAACLSFARDRYDLLKSLSVKEIRTLVEGGCPNISRKAVNSAKRLRVHVQLQEADVCAACHMRSSCDRAYLLLQESDTDARTVDIVRLLLTYALDPLAVPPPRTHLVDSSARILLSQLIQLSDTALDPALPRPAPPQKKPPSGLNGDWNCLRCDFLNFARNTKCLKCKGHRSDCEMIREDWICSKCNFLNFGKNLHCLKCKADRPGKLGLNSDGPRKPIGVKNLEMKEGDWNCPQCNFMNFARNIQCLKCKAEGPKRVRVLDVEMKTGDWDCPQCHYMNFARNKNCLRCQESRPPRQLDPGEWECPSCDFVNYRRNEVCFKCKGDRLPQPNEYEEQMWKRPN